jgi:hypothetical protein
MSVVDRFTLISGTDLVGQIFDISDLAPSRGYGEWSLP